MLPNVPGAFGARPGAETEREEVNRIAQRAPQRSAMLCIALAVPARVRSGGSRARPA